MLIIDDEMPIRDGMCELLGHWGCLPVAAENFQAGCLALNEAIPDAIVADLRLREGVSGIALIAELRRLAQRNAPALLISGDTSAESVRAMHESGITILTKPVRPAQLRAMLSHLLR